MYTEKAGFGRGYGLGRRAISYGTEDLMSKEMLRLAAVLALALATSGCSTMSDVGDEVSSAGDSIGSALSDVGDAIDPGNWFGENQPAVAEAAPDQVAPPAGTPDQNVSTPDLAALPPPPAAITTPDNQAQVAGSLAADRAQSGYSADVLRGGSEAAAAPPPPAGPRTAFAAPPSTQPAAPGVLPDAPPDAGTPLAAQGPVAAPIPQAPVRAAASTSNGQPAVPAVAGSAGPASMQRMAINTATPSDAALGFKPSTAPALDPSISQWVAPPIVSRYQQTAALAGVKTSPVVSPVASAASTRALRTPRNVPAEGGPDVMTGAVVANLDAVQNTPTASVYANMGVQPPAAVVLFPGDGTVLNADGKAQIRAAVEAFKAHGGQGFIRVVGHASSRTGNMPVEQHLTVIFDKSQSRANAVAQELIRQGVPASKVLIEAVGDSQPIYYESMPEGENGNRRAEIFLQG